MSEFDDFLAERGYIRGYKHDYQIAYDYGAQSKQAEIDELQHKVKCEREISLFADKLCVDLQSQVDELQQSLGSERLEQIKGYSKISDLRLEIDELRKRIDEALHLIKITYGNCHTESIKQILKGTTNEQ